MENFRTSNITKLFLFVLILASGFGKPWNKAEFRRKLHELLKQQTSLLSDKRSSKASSLTLPFVHNKGIASLLDKIAPIASGLNECRDFASWCDDYKDYCSDYEQVKENCPLTCSVCKKEESCKDTHPSCDSGVQFGYCQGSEREKEFMKQYCPLSCNYCTPSTETGTKTETCTDTQGGEYCSQIKDLGYCTYSAYQERFKQYCKKSCNLCQDCGKPALRSKNESMTIVGGVTTKKGYHPWQVAIYYKEKFICGGTLISERDIVTAAHCFNNEDKIPSNYKIILGEYQRGYQEGTEQEVKAETIKIHEQYKSSEDHHDIAIVKLSENAKFSNYISKLCMPHRDASLPAGTKCYITGWGKMYSSGDSVKLLQQVEVPIADRNVCAKRNQFNFHVVTDKMVCAGYSDGSSFASGCHGDSGGPLQCEFDGKWYLYGIVSWGSPLCNGLDRFTVFTRVSSYIRWIESSRTI